jgi:hypothetical protein
VDARPERATRDERVAQPSQWVHAGPMGEADQQFYWCLKHNKVESGDQLCRSAERLGPFSDRAAAERALETVRARNESWEAEDKRWDDDR